MISSLKLHQESQEVAAVDGGFALAVSPHVPLQSQEVGIAVTELVSQDLDIHQVWHLDLAAWSHQQAALVKEI